ncbi:hypothetical protein HDU81_002741 [Chytriomyces hyalinus]|nr:hypothetical protein HDU81_002741 [Chytriomyces hyalinus]
MAGAVILNPYLILYEELRRRGRPWTFTNIFSRINVIQFALNVSCTVYLYSIRKQFLETEEEVSIGLQIATATCLGLCESFYLGIGNLITGWVLLGIVAVSVTVSLLNVYVILYEELQRRGKPWTLGNFFTRINTCQIGMNLSSVFYFCSLRTEFLHLGESQSTQLQIFTATFLGLCESFYTWFRSSELVKVHTSSTFATILRYIVLASPILYLSPGVFLVFNSTQGHSIVLIANGILTLVLDAIFATRFLRQILQLRNVNIPVPEQVKIIAFYGLLSSGVCSLAIISFAATVVLNNAAGGHAIPQNAPVSYYVAFNLVFFFFAMVSVVALVMKWRLGRPEFFARDSVQNLARDLLSDKESGHVKLSNVNVQHSTVV